MTYGAEFLRVSFGFVALNSEETGQTELSLASTVGGVTAETLLGDWDGALLQTLADYLDTCMSGGSFAWADYSVLKSVKMSAINIHGHSYVDPVVKSLDNSRAGTVHQVHPQLSTLISLWSGHTVGKGNYGRMYLPHCSTSLVNSTPRSAVADADANAAAAKTFLDSVNVLAQGLTHPTIVSIMSQAIGTNAWAVSYARCGRVTDTQRRRYAQLKGEYSSAKLA